VCRRSCGLALNFGWLGASHQGFGIPAVSQLVASLPGTHEHPVPSTPTQMHPVSPLRWLCGPPPAKEHLTPSVKAVNDFLSLIKRAIQLAAPAPRSSAFRAGATVSETREGIGSRNRWGGVGMLPGSALPSAARSALLSPRLGGMAGGGLRARGEPRGLGGLLWVSDPVSQSRAGSGAAPRGSPGCPGSGWSRGCVAWREVGTPNPVAIWGSDGGHRAEPGLVPLSQAAPGAWGLLGQRLCSRSAPTFTPGKVHTPRLGRKQEEKRLMVLQGLPQTKTRRKRVSPSCPPRAEGSPGAFLRRVWPRRSVNAN